MRPNDGDELARSLAHFIVSGAVHRLSSLRHLVGILSLSPNLPSSLSLSLPLALHYFHLLPSSTTFLFNLLIRAFSRSHHPHLSLSLFSSLLRSAALPDRFTFPSLAVSHASRNAPREGHQSHSHIIKNGFDSDLYVINTLIFMYSAFRDMKSSRKVFDFGFQVVDVVSWNSVIDGYVKSGALDNARKLFDEMPVRNEVSWSAIISGYVGKGELDVARFLFDRMPMIGRNVVTWNSMVSGFARHGLVSLARELFDQMPVRNVVSWNSMVSGYAMNGEMTAARELFEAMPEKDLVSWSCMISGYVHTNQHAEALELFKRMQTESDARPNEVTMVSVLSACAHLSALDQGKWIHAYIDKNHMILEDDNNLGAALIDMYAKCGSLETGVELFRTMDRKNVSSWNALIAGMAINGTAVESLDAFERMQESGVRPNDITFLGVLTACTHGGLVVEGRRYFESMSKDYGIEPEMKHYGCMIDLLGRAGLLEEAERIIRSMPMKADVMVLGALLGACRIHKNIEVADRIRNEFLELKSRQAGCHVLLSNIYAAAGRWSDASRMRSLLKEKGIKKEPGSSSVELDGVVYEFVAGDRSHPEADSIYSWLDKMSGKLRAHGYSPATEDVLLDLDEEDKETWLSCHSEKLALAFALSRAAPPSTIRIVKNLRICRDCHSFVTHVSRLFSHEILVRDRIRFHQFQKWLLFLQ
ncbi:pentatricopeptide repeat-containing protein At1g08070, chloroplastic-like [Dioscorea cayenensis subsp. rotundata]|uniref:Pentatricopeptide repeat-containing protein At1g08070, chloroplastic-like n=1 Tax=Dioscorea cayennensis subsp. rotundata TaxID=55577 RepID=A0AB40AV09_DIOCR|nr:pentatricopeptide repeat-containing protein At1g08070, chloroplastic-like [Dioscorea cayenensis subsp. rotundata]